MRNYWLAIVLIIVASSSFNARGKDQIHRDQAAISTLIVIGREVASSVIRDHADEIRSIGVFEGCDHKDLAIALREKFKPDWRGLAEQHIGSNRSTPQPSYFIPMIAYSGNAATQGLIDGYTAAIRDLLAAGVIDKAFCEPENLQKYLH